MTTLRSTPFASLLPRSAACLGVLAVSLGTLLAGCSSAVQDPNGPALPDQEWTVGAPGTTATTSADSQNAAAAAADGGAAAASLGTGSSSSTGTAPGSPAPAADAGAAPAADAGSASTVCVAPTDMGNADGVGKFCATASDCASGLVCSSAFSPPAGDTFCSKICTTDADCGGDGATCFTANGVSACVTAACAPVAAKLF